MTPLDAFRTQLAEVLDWRTAHADFDGAIAGLPEDQRGAVPPGLPYSPWQLVEHIRLAQADILAYATKADYEEGKWPDDYWPPTPGPPDAAAWDTSIAAIRRDLATMRSLVLDDAYDLLTPVPSGGKATLLREALLMIDHTAYHVGQLVVVRRLLGVWPAT